MNPYLHFVTECARFAREGKQYPLGGFPTAPRPAVAPGSPKVLIFSPHPDDECVIGAIALRFLREAGRQVINVAVTQGSNPARQEGRWAELQQACQYLGFDLVGTAPHGLEKVSRKTRDQDPAAWGRMVEVIANVLRTHRPEVILFPHERDWNSTHIGVYCLVTDALRSVGPGFTCFTVETEFWGQMDDPNLMVESSTQDVADLITALSFHVGEVKRNPYHIVLPAWMLDNVRRGGELVGGQGGAAPDLTFATLYRLRRWNGQELERFYTGGRNLPASVSPATLLD